MLMIVIRRSEHVSALPGGEDDADAYNPHQQPDTYHGQRGDHLRVVC